MKDWSPETMKNLGIELEIHPDKIELVNQITHATSAGIVISSSWRIGDYKWWYFLKQELRKAGLSSIILGRTPSPEECNSNGVRGIEVQAFINGYPREITNFVILDDHDNMFPVEEHLVQTDHRFGIQSQHVKEAIKILNNR